MPEGIIKWPQYATVIDIANRQAIKSIEPKVYGSGKYMAVGPSLQPTLLTFVGLSGVTGLIE